jgi:L-threonylcarbamoyladenylate synthase
MSPMHYAPKTKFCIVESLVNFIQENPDLKMGMLTLGKNEFNQPNTTCINLSFSGDLEEASTNLYNSMYSLDGIGLDCIIIELFPEIGIGKSLNDRIRRASFR